MSTDDFFVGLGIFSTIDFAGDAYGIVKVNSKTNKQID